MKFYQALITTSVLATLVACTAPNALMTHTDSKGATSITTRTSNPILLTEIGVDRVNMIEVGTLKKVAIAIKNQRFNNKHFFYKIVWVDAQGIEVNPEGAIWKPIELTGREIKSVQSLAPNPSAVDTVVYLKK